MLILGVPTAYIPHGKADVILVQAKVTPQQRKAEEKKAAAAAKKA